MFFEYFGLFKGQKPHRNTRHTTLARRKEAQAARQPEAKQQPALECICHSEQSLFCKNSSAALPPRATIWDTANCTQRRSGLQNWPFRRAKRCVLPVGTACSVQQNASIGTANGHL